jgi:hypothetical protein
MCADRKKEGVISTSTNAGSITAERFEQLVQAHLDGRASEGDVGLLTERKQEWVATLRRLLADAEAKLERVSATVTGPERDLVLADFDNERRGIATTLTALAGPPRPVPADGPEPVAEPAGTPQLQLSWARGHIVAWGGGAGCGTETADDVLARLHAAGAAADTWAPRDPIKLPDGTAAPAVEAPIHSVLGWLVALGASEEVEEVGASAVWLGHAAGLAVRLTAQGRMVPQLETTQGDRAGGGKQQGRQGGSASFSVRWAPALIDPQELGALAGSLPGSVGALHRPRDARVFTETVVGDFVNAICTDAAARIEVPAPPPQIRSDHALAETVLARLDGQAFEAPAQRGSELGRKLRSWSKAVAGRSRLRLVVQLDPPDAGEAWHLRTLTALGTAQIEPVDAAMSKASNTRREAIKRGLDRLETLYHPLARSKDRRRGQVMLSQDEAWELMTSAGSVLISAGFDVRVPPLSRRKPAPGLRLTSTEAQDAVVGAQQLTTVQWSAVFDDVELTAADINRLAAEARPLVKARGRWVELDHADLEAAAAALAERADQTRLTGGDMLRHALGLEGTPLAGGISVEGDSWAADLLRSAGQISEHHDTQPPGFTGELRSYQANALAWLEFLDGAGLGGCLALDMGLGKTPVMLAHLRGTIDQGPQLVIAPPAVVGNWAAEARRFTPDLRVVVHHGPGRADHHDIAEEVAGADMILTTYGTAVRDIEALSDITWAKVVLDEAQVIKNPLSETAQQLRRLEAGNRVVLTGTPIENGLGDLWALLDFTNPGLVGDRASFVSQLSRSGEARSSAEQALRTLNGVLVFRRTKAEPAIAAELPDRIDVLDHCPMTPEQIGLYQAVLDDLVADSSAAGDGPPKKGAVLAAITALKQICNHPAAYRDGRGELDGRSGKLARCEEIVENVFTAGERVLVFTHFATWGEKLAAHLTERTGVPIDCYHGGLSRGARDRMVKEFQEGEGPGALVLSLKAGGTGLNLTAASHVVLYDRWWNPAVEDQARDRAWRIGQTRTVVAHRLVCPGTVDERVEEVVAGKRRIADLVLPESSTVEDLHSEQLRAALGLDPDAVLTEETVQLPADEGAAA